MMIRLPTLEIDYWTLRSAEISHKENPDLFPIPPREIRENLSPGDAAKLIFDIEGEEDGEVLQQGERMWVVVSGRVGETYLGILVDAPVLIDSESNFYLQNGVEVPFLPEHIIDLDKPPRRYVKKLLRQGPIRQWPGKQDV